MKFLIKNFINGILTIVPIILVFYCLYKVFTFLDGLLGRYLLPYMKDSYIPGIGIILTLIIITFLGFLSNQYISGKLIKLIDIILEKIPLVKTIYTIIKDTFQSFLGEKRSFSKVALVIVPGTEMKAIGFITSEELEQFADPLKDHIAVYIPQTFQVAGITFLIPKEQVTVLDVKPEDAMKFVLSAGVATKKNTEKEKG